MGKEKGNEEQFEFENTGAVRLPWPVDGPADTWKTLVARTRWERTDNGYWTTGHIFVAKLPESARNLKITSKKVHPFGKVDQVVAEAFGPAFRATPVAVMRSGPHVLHENSNAIVFSTSDGSEYYVPENQARLLMAEYPSAEWFVAEYESGASNELGGLFVLRSEYGEVLAGIAGLYTSWVKQLFGQLLIDNEPETVWIVGRCLPGGPYSWALRGVYRTEREAVAACESENDFVGPAAVGVGLSGEWDGQRYPKAEGGKS